MSTNALSAKSDRSNEGRPLQSLICPKCNVKYPNIHELLTHQAAEKHFACDQCALCFSGEIGLRDHKRKDHRPDIDLECFGCHAHFNRAGSFWGHLESGKCRAIDPRDLTRLRNKRLEFAKQLEERKTTWEDVDSHVKSHINGDNTWASDFEQQIPLAGRVAAPVLRSRPVPISTANAHPLYYRIEDFPVLPTNRKGPTAPSPGVEKKENVWLNRKAAAVHTPAKTSISYNSVPPPVSYEPSPPSVNKHTFDELGLNRRVHTVQARKSSTEYGQHDATSNGLIINPSNCNYNAKAFYNELLQRFVCPYKICNKKYNDAHSLARHLRSPAHAGGRMVCIRCKKAFPTVANLIGHMESSTTNCRIRDTDDFRRALGQLTGGILDFHARSDTFLIDEKSVQELLNLRGA
ncbi:hypothetical protein F5Y08DRAFT_331699 [Xylaria arbuscula]|nr:hypothetical protein F5Y08DRAFT_331699 [Xylaria arbuscula]